MTIKIVDFFQGAIGTPADKILQWDPKKQAGADPNKHGTIAYTAPEVIRGSFDSKCDVWSIGIIIFTLMCGEPPFVGADDVKIANAILKGSFMFRRKPIHSIYM